MPARPKAFVAGATGHTGRAVVARLTALDVPTVAHVRPDTIYAGARVAAFTAQGASVTRTPWEAEAMTTALREVSPTAVFALLGTTAARAREAALRGEDASYEAVDLALTRMLMHAALTLPEPPRFVYLSSAGAGSRVQNHYLSIRSQVEEELSASGLPYVIARPSTIAGDREHASPMQSWGTRLGDAALAAVGALGAKHTRERFRSQTQVELAQALVTLALDPEATARIVESDQLRALGTR